MDKEVYIKEELETPEEEWDIKGETEWPLKTQFVEVKEEIEQKFICGEPSNAGVSSSEVKELLTEETKPLLIDRTYGCTTLCQTSTSQTYTSEHLTELRRVIVEDTPLTSNLHEEENLDLTHQRPGEKKSSIQPCPVCKESLKSLIDLKKHSIDHAEDWPYNCFKCNKVYTRKFGFQKHMLMKHGVDRPYVCNVCKITFKEAKELSNHTVSHNGKWPYFCTICNKAFTRNYSYCKHMRLHAVLRPYKCSICLETFKSRLDHERHKCVNDGPEDHTFGCSICGRVFNVRASLARHFILHSQDRPHSCTLCNKSFKSKATLLNHTARHTTERPFNCTTCGKSFRLSFDLKRHMLLHLGERRHVCTLCGKAFTRGFHLKRHNLSHERDLP
ncbi:zinc finger protein 836 [Anabrus simplex]|uniref:zinc finger protein 836 n=1 Tax=Anabrus simplex TaxID=316456 RepID=UPI0035A33662